MRLVINGILRFDFSSYKSVTLDILKNSVYNVNLLAWRTSVKVSTSNSPALVATQI